MAAKFVSPVAPYKSALPNSRIAAANEPSRKYLIAASDDRALVRRFQDGFAAACPGVVNQDVRAAEGLFRLCYQVVNVVRLADISFDRYRPYAVFGGDLLGSFLDSRLVSRAQRQVDAFLRQSLRYRQPDAQAAPRDDCYLILNAQTHDISSLSLSD